MQYKGSNYRGYFYKIASKNQLLSTLSVNIKTLTRIILTDKIIQIKLYVIIPVFLGDI